MSRLHELAVDLGVEVDEFASRIEEEKRKINELKTLFDNYLKGHWYKEEGEVEAETSALEANLERLQRDMFVSASAAATNTSEPHLTKVLHEVRAAAQRMICFSCGEERMEVVVGGCKANLGECEVLCRRNCMLVAFINDWSKRLAKGKHLSDRRKLLSSISRLYTIGFSNQILKLSFLSEEKLEEEEEEEEEEKEECEGQRTRTPNTTSDSAMDVSKVDASATETSSGMVDGMMYNAAMVDTLMARVGGDSDSSIGHGADSEGKFILLDCLDTMLSDGQGE
ncbi:unnamed protein product [Taenia asiatica]|uniref:GTD-binding domain-containing protein n=1 Tax=Taenia asiatica TaxID=60517 RepID=A0A0R3WFF7_TAEAS|nr:unnamed protein product [Taenia asiatica]